MGAFKLGVAQGLGGLTGDLGGQLVLRQFGLQAGGAVARGLAVQHGFGKALGRQPALLLQLVKHLADLLWRLGMRRQFAGQLDAGVLPRGQVFQRPAFE